MLTLCSIVLAVLSFPSNGNAAFHPGFWEEMAAELAAQQYGDAEPFGEAEPIGGESSIGNANSYGDTEALIEKVYGIRGNDGWGGIVRDDIRQEVGRDGVGFKGMEDEGREDEGMEDEGREDEGMEDVIDARNSRGVQSFQDVYDLREDGADRDAAGGADDMLHDVVARMADYIDWDDLPQQKEPQQKQKQQHQQQQHQQRSSGIKAGEEEASTAEEDIHHSHIFGSDAGGKFQYMTGGAGEGVQWLKPEGTVHNKQEVKTDRFLPAYCDPPNPCPVGFTAEDGCDPSPREKFTADYSKLYQSSQDCHCDREHNYGCSTSQSKNKSVSKEEEDLFKNNLKDLARMFSDVDQDEEKRGGEPHLATKKIQNNNNNYNNNNNNNNNRHKFSGSRSNPYLVGEPLKRVAKKFPSDFRM